MKVAITINTSSEVMVKIIAWDNTRPFTSYTNRVGTVNGSRTFKIRLPRSPKQLFISISNQENGEYGDIYRMNNGQLEKVNQAQADPTFSVTKIKEENLFQDRSRYDSNNPNVKSALKFFEEFSERAGFLTAGGSVYYSNDGKYTIRYLDVIRDTNEFIEDENGNKFRNPEFGQEVVTPARIGWDTGLIEVSKKHFIGYTIGERLIILLHEFSHGYRNNVKENEKEADRNALKIYLPEGYPRIEAFKAFLTVFMTSPTDQNEERSEQIDSIISKYESHEYKQAA